MTNDIILLQKGNLIRRRSYGYQSVYYTYAFLLSSLEQEHISVTNEDTMTNDIILLQPLQRRILDFPGGANPKRGH